MGNKKVGIIVLASGFSRRFGENKLSYEIDGKPMIQRVIEAVSNIEDTVVCAVTKDEDIRDICTSCGVECIHNPSPQLGQSESIVLGVKRFSDADGVLIIPGDMPYLKKSSVEKIVGCFLSSSDNIVAGECDGVVHPVLFPRGMFKALICLRGDIGARGIVKKNADILLKIPISSREQMDIDTKDSFPI